MLTPAFELHQEHSYLLLTIKAPYIKANDVEIYMEQNEFKFFVKPYFLRLYFPCEIIEDGREKAQYDISTGIFTIHIPKKNIGEEFPNLDMLTTLLAPKKKHVTKPLIEVVCTDDTPSGKTDNEDCLDDNNKHQEEKEEDEEDEDDDMCWEVEQEVYQPKPLDGYSYGFASQTTGVFARLKDELFDVIDLPDPENTSPQERKMQRQHSENEKFDVEHYQADYLDDEYIQELIRYQTPWDVEYKRIIDVYKNSSYPETSEIITPKGKTSLFAEETKVIFTDEENNKLLQLPNKEYLLSREEEHQVLLGLVDIIFAHAYDYRTTEGEHTSESAWTISKISSTLCWCDSFRSLQDVLVTNMRRCLCYPLYRHWRLIQAVLNDVQTIFLLGKRWLIKSLLDIQSLFQADESKYILNELYISDLCVWIQKVKDKKILSLANKLRCMDIEKSSMDFNLLVIEEKASSMYDSKHTGMSSGSDTDSSSDSSDGDNSDTTTDSDDIDDVISKKDVAPSAQVVDSQHVIPPSKIGMTSSELSGDMNVVCTGLSELLQISEHVNSTKLS